MKFSSCDICGKLCENKSMQICVVCKSRYCNDCCENCNGCCRKCNTKIIKKIDKTI